MQLQIQKNPIYQAEFRHQRYVISNSRSGWFWIVIAGLMIVPPLLGSIIVSVLTFFVPFYPALIQTMLNNGFLGNVVYVLLIIMNIAMLIVVTLVTLGLATNSIRREKTGRTWDNLRLTQIGAGRIIRGKWWASLRAMWGDHLMLAVLRSGLLIFFLLFIQQERLLSVSPAYLIFQLATLHIIVFIYTALDAGLTVAIGLNTALVDLAGGTLRVPILAFRVLVTGVAIYWMYLTFMLLHANGIAFLLFSLLGFAIYGLLIWGTLRFAERLVN